MKIFGMIIAAVVVSGCESNLEVMVNNAQGVLSKEKCLANPAYPGCAEYLNGLDFSITRAKPVVAGPGETVTIYGENFSEGMLLNINGQEVSVSVTSETEASFLMPVGLANGKVDAIGQKNNDAKPFLLFARVDDTYPLITQEPTEVCQGKKYYNAADDILEGAKDCGDGAPACVEDGQKLVA